MDFLINNWLLIVVAFVAGALLVWPAVNAAPRGNAVSVTDAVALINREKALVVDVSEPDEFAKGHVGGAKNVPLAKVESDLPALMKGKPRPVVLVCPTGARSAKAAALAKKAGLDNVRPLNGGTNAWRAASMPIEASA